MKKTLLFMGMVIAPVSMAAAKTITFDTPVEWNSSVIEQALNKAGFVGSSDAKWDVRVTHERILAELLKRKTFSLKDATQVCLNKCNMSDFLKNGRGASHKKCPELCKGFADSLTSINNSFKSKGSIPIGDTGLVEKLKDGTYKVWTKDRKYYALYADYLHENLLKKYSNICKISPQTIKDWGDVSIVVFNAESNQPIHLATTFCEGGGCSLYELCSIDAYKNFEFGMYYEDYKPVELEVISFDQEVKSKYENVKKELIEYQGILDSLKKLDTNSLRPYAEKFYNKLQDGIRSLHKTLSYCQNITADKNSDCINGIHMDWTKSLLYQYDDVKNCVRNIKNKNGQKIDWTNVQTREPQDAYELAKKDMVGDCQYGVVDDSKVKCSGDCNKMWGTDDTVTCTYYDITVQYVFDDICDRDTYSYKIR